MSKWDIPPTNDQQKKVVDATQGDAVRQERAVARMQAMREGKLPEFEASEAMAKGEVPKIEKVITLDEYRKRAQAFKELTHSTDSIENIMSKLQGNPKPGETSEKGN
ncbi:MAG: hypothetical protein AAB920_01155 [Patescibacteria group bacterium]